MLLFSSPVMGAGSTVISGKVDVNWSSSVKLSNGAITLTDSWIDRLAPGDSKFEVDEEGKFRLEVQITEPDFYRIAHESNEVEFFISPGDSLYIDFNAEAIFSGTNGKINDHLSDLRGIINSNRRYINKNESYNLQPEELDSVLDSLTESFINVHRAYREANPVHEVFHRKVMADITYRGKLIKLSHPAIYKMLTGDKLPVEEDYFETISAGSFDTPERLKSLDYVLFLNEYLNVQATGDYKFDIYFEAPIERIHPKYYQIQQLDAHQDIKDYLLTQHLHKSMDSYGVSYLGDLMEQYEENCKSAIRVDQIKERYQAGLERRKEPDTVIIYKRIGNIELEAHVFYPEGHENGDNRPTYVFFHGGGWAIGIPEWGYKACKRYSSQGMVAISFEYRLVDIHKSNILDCIEDAKSAIVWTREQAKSLGVDPERIVAAGFSAGAHLATCTAVMEDIAEASGNGISSRPNSLIVQSASYNTTKSNWFSKQSEGKPESISTFHNLGKELVPAIFFHASNDHLAPISEFTEFKDKLDANGIEYEYKVFENVGHFFSNPSAQKEVDLMTEMFLMKQGYINKP